MYLLQITQECHVNLPVKIAYTIKKIRVTETSQKLVIGINLQEVASPGLMTK